jgi:hypothetical protein
MSNKTDHSICASCPFLDNVSAKEKLNSLSSKAKAWLHLACEQMADAGEYVDDTECRSECVNKGVVNQLSGRQIEISAEISDLVYSQGYLAP